ncbi:MAG: hypothetical protein AAB815_02280, partial [Patescibacteria group bacterium]
MDMLKIFGLGLKNGFSKIIQSPLLESARMPRLLCSGDEWPKLNMRGGGRILIQQNTMVSVRQCPVRFVAGMARRTVLLLFTLSIPIFFIIPTSVQAGVIINRPFYSGLTDGLVGYWTFDGPDMAGVT